VDGDPLFADLEDEWNALRVTTGDGRVFTARGRGAGRTPTAESVWADLTDLAGLHA
jgi:homoserine dehydrogenase